MNSKEPNIPTGVDGLFEQWKEEHCQLDQCAMELSTWLHEQSLLRTAQFREAVKRIHVLSERLSAHFAREQAIASGLVESRGWVSQESLAVQRQSERDHSNISTRLKHLIDRMQEGEAECDAWATGVHEMNLILDVLEQHEEQEAESVGWLLPRDLCKTTQKGTPS